MTVVARIIRQFEAPDRTVTLEKILTLTALPGIGSHLDLAADSVLSPLEIIGVTLRPEPHASAVPGRGRGIPILAPSSGGQQTVPPPPPVDLFLAHEPLAAAAQARAHGWRDATRA